MPTCQGATVELTQSGLEFLTSLFEKHDLDRDQALSTQEMISLFSTCPSMPWGPEVFYQVPTSTNNWIGLPGYLAWWNLQSLLEPDKCCELLAHLGYDYYTPHLPHKLPPLASTKDKKSDLAKRQTNKTVYSCLVVGPRDAGKTTFCQRFLNRSIEETGRIGPDEKPKSLVNSVIVYGQQKYLVMMDADVLTASDGLNYTQTHCDVVCLVYDASNPRSFEYCARIYLVMNIWICQHPSNLLLCSDISPQPKFQSWSWQTKVMRELFAKIIFFNQKLSVPSTNFHLLRKHHLELRPPKISSLN